MSVFQGDINVSQSLLVLAERDIMDMFNDHDANSRVFDRVELLHLWGPIDPVLTIGFPSMYA